MPDLPASEQLKSRQTLLIELARREKLTIRQLAHRVATARGHLVVVGTAEEVADAMQTWLDERAADGFNVMPAYFPGELTAFAEQVVPILQERGLFRRDYEADTLRGHFGWPRVAIPPIQGTRATGCQCAAI